MPKIGKVWKYFSVADKNNKKAQCNFCKKRLSFKSTITNLKNHLRHKHIHIFKEICVSNYTVKKKNRRLVNTEASAVVNIRLNTGSIKSDSNDDGGVGYVISNSGPSTQKIPKEEFKMISALPEHISHDEKIYLDKLLLNMIAIDCHPFGIVNDEGFKAFIHELNPNYKLPDRKTLSGVLLPEEYEERLAKIKDIVSTQCSSMCITIDCWTSQTIQTYMAIMGHFINESTLDFKSILLQCSLLDSHTGKNIAQAVHTTIREWNLVGKVNFFVTDNTSNKESAANLLGFPYCGCYAYSLNLVAQHALTVPELEDVLCKIKKTVFYFKHSPQAKEKLIKYQIDSQGIPEESALSLIMSVPTRWNSTFLMLQRFVHLKEAIKSTICNLNVDLPFMSFQDWQCLEQYCEVLAPLYEATLIVSGRNHLIASKAFVTTQGLLNIYERMMVCSTYFKPVKTLINNIDYGLKQEFSNFAKNMQITVCTFLDPRFKHCAFDEETLTDTLKYVTDQVCGIIGENKPKSIPENSVASLSLWSAIEQKILQSQQPRSTYTKVTEELELYMKQVVIDRESCPLEWWRGHKNIYPSLFLIFVKYFNIIVTTVPCEQAFSKTGHIIKDRRTRLSSSKVAQLMFLHGNKDF